MFDRKKNRHEYYLKNKEIEKSRSLSFYFKNKEQQSIKHKEWLSKNRELNNQKRKNRYKNDIDYRINTLLRSRFYKAFKRYSKKSSCLEFIGCTLDEFKIHIESLFIKGMNWDNWSYHGWHLDHIVPISSFDLSIESNVHDAFHYKNLQPLWKQDNLLKSNRV